RLHQDGHRRFRDAGSSRGGVGAAGVGSATRHLWVPQAGRPLGNPGPNQKFESPVPLGIWSPYAGQLGVRVLCRGCSCRFAVRTACGKDLGRQMARPPDDLPAHTRRAARAIWWSALEIGFRYVIQFIVVVVLARLLAPDDFGLIAMLLVFTTVATLVV